MKNDYCDVLNDGFGCSFRDDKDCFDPESCFDCLSHLLRDILVDRDYLFELLKDKLQDKDL